MWCGDGLPCLGQVVATEQKVESCSIQDVELHATKVFVVSGSLPRLPLQVDFTFIGCSYL